ncbi:MAG: DUF1772 domain-containing protein [Sphingobium sp.]|nr:DUF1772 domain-containing protein [Sphingobium sp.]
MIFAVVALVLAALFAGAAFYISLVEHPARLMLEDGPMLAQWQPSYARALPIQAGLAVVGSLAGLASWYVLPGDWRSLAGSLVLLANWPFTLLVVMPVNKQLQAMQPSQASATSRQLLLTWGKLHNVRSGLGVCAILLFAWELSTTC